MDTKPERLARLMESSQDPDDYQEAVEGIREGYADYKAGRTQRADEMFEELRKKRFGTSS